MLSCAHARDFHALGLIPDRKSCNNRVALPMLAMETEMKTQPTTRGSRALTLIELLVVVCVVAVLTVILLPALIPHHNQPHYLNCVNNLKQIGLAFRIWEGDNGDKFPMQVSVTNGGAMEPAVAGNVSTIFGAMSNELSTPKVLVCRGDANRHVATNFTTGLNHQTISYFVGLDADDKYPQMILSGDDNLQVNGVRVRSGLLILPTNSPFQWTKERIGKSHGPANVVLADGSVQTITSAALQQAVQQAGAVTNRQFNRLVIP
jgi:competence protein ComGC